MRYLRSTALCGLVAFALTTACSDEPVGPGPTPPTVSLAPVVDGLSAPVFLTAPTGDTTRLMVVERGGTIRVVRVMQRTVVQPGGTTVVRVDSLLATPFLDVGPLIDAGGEQGLLGLAFHPEYQTNGHFFVNYTDTLGHTRIVRYQVSGDPDVADPGSAFPILTVQQPYSNHNGGMIAFGPHDGMLYIGMGDGGSGGDPHNHGQNRMTLLGDMLRIDVDGGSPYAIPADNPFAGNLSVANEIWASGLRNPWRWSFDEGGDLYIGDVGQGEVEEIDFQPASSNGGENYGWRIVEGTRCYNPSTGCTTTGLTPPIHTYTHADGCSVTGGYVYRGRDLPEYVGHYFFADFCGTWLGSFQVLLGRAEHLRDHSSTAGPLLGTSSFGMDAFGEIYVVSLTQGTVKRIVPTP